MGGPRGGVVGQRGEEGEEEEGEEEEGEEEEGEEEEGREVKRIKERTGGAKQVEQEQSR